jgi:hypothetical protein
LGKGLTDGTTGDRAKQAAYNREHEAFPFHLTGGNINGQYSF